MLSAIFVSLLLLHSTAAVEPVPARCTQKTYTVLEDGMTCREWAYQPGNNSPFFFLVDGKHCDDVAVKIAKGSQLTVVSRVLQGRVGFGATPPKLSDLPPCYNQLVVYQGILDGTGAGTNGGSLGTSISAEELSNWKGALPGRQIIFALKLAKPTVSQAAWLETALGSLGALSASYSANGFELDGTTTFGDAGAAQALINAVKQDDGVFISLEGTATSLKNADTAGYNGQYWRSYPMKGYNLTTTSYYVYTTSSSYVTGGLKKIPITTVFGVTVDSVEAEQNGKSCTSGTEAVAAERAGPRSSAEDACVAAACPNGGCCPTCWVANAWGVPCTWSTEQLKMRQAEGGESESNGVSAYA
jgi:hypothetical protein